MLRVLTVFLKHSRVKNTLLFLCLMLHGVVKLLGLGWDYGIMRVELFRSASAKKGLSVLAAGHFAAKQCLLVLVSFD